MGVGGPRTTCLHFLAALLIYWSLPVSGRGSCLSENWWEERELGKIQLSCSQEGNRVCLSLFLLEKTQRREETSTC